MSIHQTSSLQMLASVQSPAPGGLPRIEPTSSLWRALREAIANGASGEIAIRCGEHTGRIHVVRGVIGWAQISSQRVSLGEILRMGGVALDDETVAAVLDECKQSRSHFADVLLRWGVATEAELRDGVRWFLVGQLRQMFAFPEATALFLPSTWQQVPPLSFTLEELVEVPSPSSGTHRLSLRVAPFHEGLRERLRKAAERSGVLGVAVVNRSRGDLQGGRGQQLSATVIRGLLGALDACEDEHAHALISAGDKGFAAVAIDAETAVLIAFRPDTIMPGLILALLRDLAR